MANLLNIVSKNFFVSEMCIRKFYGAHVESFIKMDDRNKNFEDLLLSSRFLPLFHSSSRVFFPFVYIKNDHAGSSFTSFSNSVDFSYYLSCLDKLLPVLGYEFVVVRRLNEDENVRDLVKMTLRNFCISNFEYGLYTSRITKAPTKLRCLKKYLPLELEDISDSMFVVCIDTLKMGRDVDFDNKVSSILDLFRGHTKLLSDRVYPSETLVYSEFLVCSFLKQLEILYKLDKQVDKTLLEAINIILNERHGVSIAISVIKSYRNEWHNSNSRASYPDFENFLTIYSSEDFREEIFSIAKSAREIAHTMCNFYHYWSLGIRWHEFHEIENRVNTYTNSLDSFEFANIEELINKKL